MLDFKNMYWFIGNKLLSYMDHNLEERLRSLPEDHFPVNSLSFLLQVLFSFFHQKVGMWRQCGKVSLSLHVYISGKEAS